MSEQTETLAKCRLLLRSWERARVNGIHGLESDIALMREEIRELEQGPALADPSGSPLARRKRHVFARRG
jgi:hypothetical protein